MPGPVTHLYLASRLALDYKNHKNPILKDINDGFQRMVDANKKFYDDAHKAVQNNSSDEIEKAMSNYRQAHRHDTVAVFGAFSAGSQGPDLWILPDSKKDLLFGEIKGFMHFDMGHYNLSHRFPFISLKRIRQQDKSLAELQKKYQTAYILGYLSHIALDILGHVKVNVFAGAYHQLEKVWENEQGLLTKDIWNNHNKVEHYLDALIRFLCFEGYHEKIKGLKNIRTQSFKQDDPWYFANYSDFYDKILKFGKIIKTNGITNDDEDYLNLSVSLPGPFAVRYRIRSSPQKVKPFIHNDFCRAYEIADKPIRDHKYSVTKLENEYPKLNYFRKNNTRDGVSFYYYLKYAIPNIDKVRDYSTKFFDPGAFGSFILGSKDIATGFIDSALKFLDSGDISVLKTLKHWNLDVGMAIRLRDISKTSAKGKKPARAVCIDLVNVTEEIPECKKWTPPKLDVTNWKKNGQEEIEWKAPKEEKSAVGDNTIKGKSGGKVKSVAYPVSGIDIRFSGFKLYNDSDELGGYLFGDTMGSLPSNQNILEGKHAYAIKRCLEDFSENDDIAESKDLSVGNCKLKEYLASFITKIISPDKMPKPHEGDKKTSEITMISPKVLPRHVKVTACRKYVCKPHETASWASSNQGNFHPKKLKIYKNPFPSEEMVLAVFALIKQSKNYVDIFHHQLLSHGDVEKLKYVKSIGVNTILLIFSKTKDKGSGKVTVALDEAFIDGEKQNVPGETVNPDNPHVFLVEFEDALFRTDSAVLLPEGYLDKNATDEEQDIITGLDVLRTIYIQAKEYPKQKILIAGHTDRVAKDSFNYPLSDDRAKSIMYLLEGKKEDWAQIADKKNHNKDIQTILKWAASERGWDCNPGKIDGKIWGGTKKAILGFQKAYNKDFSKSIGEDKTLGPETWGAVFDVYQAKLAELLSTTFEKMNTFHTSLNDRWVDTEHKAVGCGECFPKDHPELDEYESAVNRRIDVLLFDPSELPATPLPCPNSATLTKKDNAQSARESCIANCPVYKDKPAPKHLSVTPHSRPQTKPKFHTISQPGGADYILIDKLYTYVAYYDDSDKLEKVHRLVMKGGILHGYYSEKPATIDGDREACFYFSHRDDLTATDRDTRFAKNKSGLPLIGPVTVPLGQDAEVKLNLWDQKDWAVFRNKSVDGKQADGIKMAEWKEDYSIGKLFNLKTGGQGFFPNGKSTEKDVQETWKSNPPIDLIQFGKYDGDPMWLGTLSLPPTEKVKLLLEHETGSGKSIFVGSYNEIKHEGDNIIIHGLHTYKKEIVDKLMAIKRYDQSNAKIDALPAPPDRAVLPGDMCWQDQGQTNNCGPYSFSTAMNYWKSYTNNPANQDGAYYAQHIDDAINGARTPKNIVDATEKFQMHGRDNDAEKLDKDRAMKLVKLWISAGVPVLILVEEEYNLWSLHWKTIAGYDQNRFFLNNSGADNEAIKSKRTPGIEYEKAPVGNDVDSHEAFWKKWKETQGTIVDALTTVDGCTFIPLYPKDQLFAGDKAQ